MLGPLSLTFPMNDGLDRLDAKAWRAVLLAGLARNGEGLVVCDVDLEILFSTPRAATLMDRLGSEGASALPESIARIVTTQRELGDAPMSERVTPKSSGNAIYVHVAGLRNAFPARTVLWLREEVLRDERLYTTMQTQYGVTRRGFQLAQLLRQGLTNRHIARELGLSEATVKVYLHELYRACGVSSRTALVALVERTGRST